MFFFIVSYYKKKVFNLLQTFIYKKKKDNKSVTLIISAFKNVDITDRTINVTKCQISVTCFL